MVVPTSKIEDVAAEETKRDPVVAEWARRPQLYGGEDDFIAMPWFSFTNVYKQTVLKVPNKYRGEADSEFRKMWTIHRYDRFFDDISKWTTLWRHYWINYAHLRNLEKDAINIQ